MIFFQRSNLSSFTIGNFSCNASKSQLGYRLRTLAACNNKFCFSKNISMCRRVYRSHLKELLFLLSPCLSFGQPRLKVIDILAARILESELEFVSVTTVHPDRNCMLYGFVGNHPTEAILPVNPLPLPGHSDLELPVCPVPLPDHLLQVLHAELHLVHPLGVRHRGHLILESLLHSQKHIPLFQ